jgi:undecaprenyl-diphosphatase
MWIARLVGMWRRLAEWAQRVPFLVRVSERWRTWTGNFLRDWALTVVLGVAMLLACAKLGEDVFEHETGSFDGAIQRWVLAHHTRLLDSVFLAITYVGSLPVMLGLALLGSLWLWIRRGRQVAAGALIAPAVATTLFFAVKQVFARGRPIVPGHVALASYAFPSGHATSSTAVCCTLAYVYLREGFITRRLALWVATLPPFLIGVSRVYLGVHWATDVLAGWSTGLLVAVLGAALYDRNRRRTAKLGESVVTA